MKCEPCQPGHSYSSSFDKSSCIPCTVCKSDQVVLKNCTPSSDTVCAKRCHSIKKYYDENGGCLPCSRCCGDAKDVVENECQEKLGAGSDMICSFSSSVNRCEKSTPPSQKPNTTKNQSTTANGFLIPIQLYKQEHTQAPPALQHTQAPTALQHTQAPTAPRGYSNIVVFISIGICSSLLLILTGYSSFCRKKRQKNNTELRLPSSVPASGSSKSVVINNEVEDNFGTFLFVSVIDVKFFICRTFSHDIMAK